MKEDCETEGDLEDGEPQDENEETRWRRVA